jgi:two-component system, sensor histidine kinase YesM
MPGIKFSFRRIIKQFMNLKLSRKLVLGYIIIILMPVLTLEITFYRQRIQQIYTERMSVEKNALKSTVVNFNTKLQQIEPISDIFQTNKTIIDYVKGIYKFEDEELYSYLKNVIPVFSYARLSNKLIENVNIYKYEKSFIQLHSEIFDVDRFKGDQEIIEELTPGDGKWDMEYLPGSGTRMKYYRSLYEDNYEQNIGFIEVILKQGKVFDNFSNLHEILYLYSVKKDMLLIFKNNDFILPEDNDETRRMKQFITGYATESKNTDVKKTFIDTVELEKLDAQLFYFTRNAHVFKSDMNLLIIALVGSFFLLSLLYFVIFSSITRRIIALDRHISNTNADDATCFQTEVYYDEVGSLIRSYNKMIERINNLIMQVYKTQLLKKDAEYNALQAQISPHFLYNVLENIRMSAESNDDTETSEMIFVLVKCLRYSLSMKGKDIKLEEEIAHIQDYLDIYKIRLGGRLKISISISTEINDVDCPYFILQPIVENAIKHGLNNGKNGQINIFVDDMEGSNDIIISVRDNGNGIEDASLRLIREYLEADYDLKRTGTNNSGGIGLKNVNERLIAFFGKEYGLIIDSKQGKGTEIKIRLRRGWKTNNENTNS